MDKEILRAKVDQLLIDASELVPTTTKEGQEWHHRFQAATLERKLTYAQGIAEELPE